MIEWSVLPLSSTSKIWHRIEKDVQDCLDLGLGTDVEIVKAGVMKGTIQVAFAVKDNSSFAGSTVFRIAQQGDKKVAYIIAITGKDIATHQSIDRLYEKLRECGADHLQCLCRPSAARLWSKFGLEPIHQLMEVKL